MGIDALEVAFLLEKRLGVKFDREEMGFLFDTVGTLEDYLWHRLQGVRLAIPLLPHQLAERLVAATLRLPGTRNSFWKTFDRMIPQRGRKENWERLGRELELPLPQLIEDRMNGSFQFPAAVKNPSALAAWLWKHHRTELPVVREVRYEDPPGDANRWPRDMVRDVLRDVLIDALGVDVSEIFPDARLVEDLGMA